MEDSDLHKEASQGDLSEDESNERYDLYQEYFRLLSFLQSRFYCRKKVNFLYFKLIFNGQMSADNVIFNSEQIKFLRFYSNFKL